MRKNLIIFCLPVVIISGCAVLSNSQLKNINAFATAAKGYSAFPGEVVRQSQQLHYNNDILEASALPDSALMLRSLRQAKEQLDIGFAFSNQMDLSLQLIQQYAALLAQLSSDDYTDELGNTTTELCASLGKTVDLFNQQLSTKIPASVGSGISEIIRSIGGRVIKSKQARALKHFIPIADTLIQVTRSNLVDALNTNLKTLIESYKATFQSDFNTIVFNHIEKANYNMLRFYIQTNEDFKNVELLREKCIQAAETMASSHKELTENIMKKKSLEELLHDTKDFISQVKELYQLAKNTCPSA